MSHQARPGAAIGAFVALELPIPPSTNRLYVRRRGGGLALTDEAKQYRELVKRELGSCLVEVSALPVGPDFVYELVIELQWPTLENKGWRADGSGTATRYRAIDTDNRVKFLKDCLAKAMGLDNDCQFFRDRVQKVERRALAEGRALIRVVVANRAEFFEHG